MKAFKLALALPLFFGFAACSKFSVGTCIHIHNVYGEEVVKIVGRDKGQCSLLHLQDAHDLKGDVVYKKGQYSTLNISCDETFATGNAEKTNSIIECPK
jgi:hypothetical protein